MAFLLVFLGGGAGSLCRFATNGLFSKTLGWDGDGLLYSTLLVNALGSLAAGAVFFLASSGMDPSDTKRLFLMAGFCGGFTTFSGFSLEVFKMLQGGEAGKALLYAFANVALSVAFLAAGFCASRAALR